MLVRLALAASLLATSGACKVADLPPRPDGATGSDGDASPEPEPEPAPAPSPEDTGDAGGDDLQDAVEPDGTVDAIGDGTSGDGDGTADDAGGDGTGGAPDASADAGGDVHHGGDLGDAGGDSNPDLDVDFSCLDDSYAPGACADGVTSFVPSASNPHVDVPTPITYAASPPSAGPHRPYLGKWGEYEFLPPQVYIHNLEHGGAAFLYHPCVEDEVVDALRAFAQARPADDGGDFRWVLSPFVDLPSAIAVVTWENVWASECFDADEVDVFLDEHYRKTDEDFASDGTWSELFLGK